MIESALLIRMHNAGSENIRFKQNSIDLRQRKSKSGRRTSVNQKMVGSGNAEPFGQDLADIRMELLELDSEDENYNNLDTKHLISSSIPNVTIEKANGISQDFRVSPTSSESVWSISIQMFIPFLLAGFGMVTASLLLDVVQVVLM